MTISKANQVPSVALPTCLVDSPDAELRCLVSRLIPFAACLLSIRKGFGSIVGLTETQYSSARSIAHLTACNDVTVNQLAEHLHLSGAFITVETNKLKTLSLIDKKTDPDDKRKMQLTMTDAGSRLLNELLPIQQSINNVLFEGVTWTEFKVLCSFVERLVINGDQAVLDLAHMQTRQQKVAKHAQSKIRRSSPVANKFDLDSTLARIQPFKLELPDN